MGSGHCDGSALKWLLVAAYHYLFFAGGRNFHRSVMQCNGFPLLTDFSSDVAGPVQECLVLGRSTLEFRHLSLIWLFGLLEVFSGIHVGQADAVRTVCSPLPFLNVPQSMVFLHVGFVVSFSFFLASSLQVRVGFAVPSGFSRFVPSKVCLPHTSGGSAG